MGDDRGVISQSRPVTISSKLTEIEFGYHHDANDSYVVYPGFDDTTVVNYGPDGSFINQQQTVTLVVHAGHNQVPLVCWILLLVLLLSTIVSIVIICCFCIRAKRSGRRNERSRVASHINGFAPTLAFSPVEMMPKYAASPAQSYSTQKLYQWCQQKEMQQYKSLWAVNPTSGPTSAIVHISDKNENPNAYKTRSLPSKHKQRPVSSIEDLDELYVDSKVNFSKKLRNRMTNDEAAIIAFCRSKSQNLSQYTGNEPKGDAMVIYDERTAL